MMAGKVNEVIPPECARKLWEAAGRPPIHWFDCGHYSAVGFLLPGIRQTVDFFSEGPGARGWGEEDRDPRRPVTDSASLWPLCALW